MAWVPGPTQRQPRDTSAICRDIRDICRDIRDICRDIRDIRDNIIERERTPRYVLQELGVG